MADLISDLASKTGIKPEMVKKGLGTLLAAFKHGLPADSFAKIEGAIPGADKLLADAQAEGHASSGGILNALKSLASKLFGSGGGDPAALAAHFGQMGFSGDQVSKFIPQVVEFLKGKLPADLMERIAALVPREAAAAH